MNKKVNDKYVLQYDPNFKLHNYRHKGKKVKELYDNNLINEADKYISLLIECENTDSSHYRELLSTLRYVLHQSYLPTIYRIQSLYDITNDDNKGNWLGAVVFRSFLGSKGMKILLKIDDISKMNTIFNVVNKYFPDTFDIMKDDLPEALLVYRDLSKLNI